MRDFVCLSLEMSIELFSFLFLSFSYFCSGDVCVVCIISGICNQSSSPLFYIISYLPNPPLGQDMTQGQFLSGV